MKPGESQLLENKHILEGIIRSEKFNSRVFNYIFRRLKIDTLLKEYNIKLETKNAEGEVVKTVECKNLYEALMEKSKTVPGCKELLEKDLKGAFDEISKRLNAPTQTKQF